MKRIWLTLAAFLGLMASAVPASADLTYTLNCSVNPCTGANATNNYGSVTLTQVGSGAGAYVTVTVDLTTASGAAETFAGTGAGYAITWDIAGAPDLSSVTLTTASPSGTLANFSVKNFVPSSLGYSRYKASPFTGGSCGATTASCFEYAIDYLPSGSTGTDNKLVFDVKKSGGLLISDFAANSNGFFFTADIFKSGATFVVGSNLQVPEPATWLLFFGGLAGLTVLQRRRKLAKA